MTRERIPPPRQKLTRSERKDTKSKDFADRENEQSEKATQPSHQLVESVNEANWCIERRYAGNHLKVEKRYAGNRLVKSRLNPSDPSSSFLCEE